MTFPRKAERSLSAATARRGRRGLSEKDSSAAGFDGEGRRTSSRYVARSGGRLEGASLEPFIGLGGQRCSNLCLRGVL